MAFYNDSLFTLVGRVRQFRPDVSPQNIILWINDRIREALDSRTYWADLLTTTVISIPPAYDTGTVAATTGSAVLTGTDTAWPVDDKVNTTIPAAVEEIGYVEVTPAAMTNITSDSVLLVDTGASQEIVPVVQVTATTFIGKFAKTHLAGVTATASSLAGLQIWMATAYPVFTVRAITSATTLTLDSAWGGAAVTGISYYIIKMYTTIANDLKEILCMIDPQYGLPIRIHVPVLEMNWRDPQRASTGPPQCLVDHSVDESGHMRYEIWPKQTSARQLGCIYHRQWPELVSDNDRPPWFINPTVFSNGAIATALRYRRDKEDPYFNPELATQFEMLFLKGLDDAKNGDESKFQKAYQYNYRSIFGAGGGNFWVSHDEDLVQMNF